MFEVFIQLYQTLKGALLGASVPFAYSWSVWGIVIDSLTRLSCPDAGESVKTIADNSSAIAVKANN